MNDPLPDWVIERYRLGELPADELAAIRARSKRDPELSARLKALDEDDDRILATYSPARIGAEVNRRLVPEPANRPWLQIAGPVVLVAAAALLGFAVLPERVAAPAVETLETTRIKGRARLEVHRQRGSGSERLADGAQASPGDVLQVRYAAGGHPYGVIVSIDGRGSVTLHHPATADQPAKLEDGGTHPLPASFRLDDAPAYERFVLVTSEQPITVDVVLDAARALATDPARARSAPLPVDGAEQLSVLVVKE